MKNLASNERNQTVHDILFKFPRGLNLSFKRFRNHPLDREVVLDLDDIIQLIMEERSQLSLVIEPTRTKPPAHLTKKNEPRAPWTTPKYQKESTQDQTEEFLFVLLKMTKATSYGAPTARRRDI